MFQILLCGECYETVYTWRRTNYPLFMALNDQSPTDRRSQPDSNSDNTIHEAWPNAKMWDTACTLIRIIGREDITVYCLLWALLMVYKRKPYVRMNKLRLKSEPLHWLESYGSFKLFASRFVLQPVRFLKNSNMNRILRYQRAERFTSCMFQMTSVCDKKGKQTLKLKEYGAQWRRPMWNDVSSWRLFCFCNQRDGYEWRHFDYMTGEHFQYFCVYTLRSKSIISLYC
jgi:hypothetical protein